MNIKNKELIEQLFRTLSSVQRLRALELFANEMTLPDVAREIRMTRTGFQRTVNDFKRLGLIEVVNKRKRTYKLTDGGRQILSLISKLSAECDEIVSKSRQSKLERELEQFVLRSGFGLDEIDTVIQQLKKKYKDYLTEEEH